ncbi:MAG: UvrD-helicase domain-containing protein [Pseudomonadota bacterium]
MTNVPDQPQRDRALRLEQSFIVQAPAGSGKTELLTQRFLHLLSHVQKPETIVAITFTNKAAAEMRARILNALAQHNTTNITNTTNKKTQQLAKLAYEHNVKMNWQLLKNPNRLNIYTFDAFCKKLVRHIPLLSQVGLSTKISDDTNALYQQAAENTLKKQSDDTQHLLSHLDNNFSVAVQLLMQMLAKRDQWLPHIMPARHQTSLKQTLEAGLIAIHQEALEKCYQTFPQNLCDDIKTLSTFAAAHSELLAFEDEHSPEISHWLHLSNLLLTNNNEWRKKIDKSIGFPAQHKDMKAAMQTLLQTLSNHESFKTALIDIRQLPPTHYTPLQWQTLTALLNLLPLAVAELKLIFHETGQTDYAEIALAALTALGDAEHPTDLALILDYEIQHLLVDEFQDTSITQFQLLEKLTREWEPNNNKTLFIVGDPMQSIYRFREAKVDLFLRAQQEGIGNVPLESLKLSMNFRSTQALVNWVNQTFTNIFPTTEDIRLGAIAFSPSTAQDAELIASSIHLHPFMDNTKPNEADHIVKIIQQNPDRSIAILVRARTHLTQIIQHLKNEHIQYQAIEIDSLSTKPIIQDLFSLTCALLYLSDRIAWLSLLRSPWCGLTLHDLHVIANTHAQSTIWQCMHNTKIIKNLSPDGHKRILFIREKLEKQLAARFRYTLRDWIHQTWIDLNGSIVLEHASDLTDAHTYFEWLEKLSQGGDILKTSQLKEHIDRLFSAPDSEATAKIQLMTIHKAKGLEFDIVIIPGLEHTKPAQETQLLRWSQRTQNNLIFAPIKSSDSQTDNIYQYLHREEQLKNNLEDARLFYVAATRAKRELHLLGTARYDETKKQFQKPTQNSFLNMIWSIAEPEFQKALNTLPATPQGEHTLKTKTVIKRLTAQHFDEIFELTAPQNIPQTNTHLEAWQAPHEAPIGIAIHQILRQISLDGLEKWQQKAFTAWHPTWKNLLLRLGISETRMADALSQIQTAIQNTLADKRGQWILKPHTAAQSEFALSSSHQQKLKRIIIDRTFLDENNRRWIIDYKTARCQTNNLDDWLAKEKQKYQSQLIHYANVLNKLHAEPMYFGLYFPLVPAWVEWASTNNMQGITDEHTNNETH